MTNTAPIKAVKIAFDIIDILRELNGAGVSEVAQRLDKPTSTVHDHLRTLEREGYLVKDGSTYHVSTRFLQLGDQARSRKKVFNIARPEIDDLAQTTGEHANLMIEEHDLASFCTALVVPTPSS